MQLMMGDAAQRVAHCESFEHCLLPSARRRSSNITNQGKHKRSRSTSRGSPGSSKSHRFQNEGIPEAQAGYRRSEARIVCRRADEIMMFSHNCPYVVSHTIDA